MVLFLCVSLSSGRAGDLLFSLSCKLQDDDSIFIMNTCIYLKFICKFVFDLDFKSLVYMEAYGRNQ